MDKKNLSIKEALKIFEDSPSDEESEMDSLNDPSVRLSPSSISEDENIENEIQPGPSKPDNVKNQKMKI